LRDFRRGTRTRRTVSEPTKEEEEEEERRGTKERKLSNLSEKRDLLQKR
jgi:hypothetical protein